MKRTKLIDCLIVLLNVVGISCLLYYGWFYIVHDHSIVNPNAMLAVERWDASGMILTIGLIPLIIVNVIYFRRSQRKYRILCLLPSLLCTCFVGHYWIDSLLHDHHEAVAQEVVKVAYQSEDGVIHYGQLYDDGGLETIDKFDFDDVSQYQLNHDCFKSDIIDNKIVNELNLKELNQQTNDKMIKHLLELIVQEIDHDIDQVDIFKDGQSYFMVVLTNVNWQDPCLFYQYINEDDQLNYLYQWDDVDIIGIAL